MYKACLSFTRIQDPAVSPKYRSNEFTPTLQNRFLSFSATLHISISRRRQTPLHDMTPNAPRPTRSAACEPCRYNKQSCGHEKPICSRCIRRGIQNECVYRDRPFKKRKLVQQQSVQNFIGIMPREITLILSAERLQPARQPRRP